MRLRLLTRDPSKPQSGLTFLPVRRVSRLASWSRWQKGAALVLGAGAAVGLGAVSIRAADRLFWSVVATFQ